MKILHIADIVNNSLNGVNVVVPQHIKHQAEFVDVRFFNISKQKIDELTEWQIEFDNVCGILPALKKIDFIPDLVVIHEANNFVYVKLYKQLIKVGIPYVIVPHGELTKGALRKKWLKKKLAYILFFNRFIKHAIAIQCLSENEKENIKFKNNKFVATNGIELPCDKKNQFNYDKLQLTYIGRLDCEHKGLDLMLMAISRIKDFCHTNNIKLAIYGPDILGRKKFLEELVRKYEIHDIVDLNDPVIGDFKKAVLLESDLFIQTSRFEGLPLGVLEALSYGLPCIVTKGTNLVEDIVGYNAGYDAGNNKAEQIAETIKFAVNDRMNWHEKSKNAVGLVTIKYDWRIVAQSVVCNYNKLINKV